MERLKGEGVQDWLSQHLTSPWHGHQTVASELSDEIIRNIHDRWTHLGPSIQLGILFSIISLKKAQQLQLKDTSQNLINHACADPDEWVRLVGGMLKDYPSNGTLRFNVEEYVGQTHMRTLLENLRNHINRDGIKFHPLEMAFLNESVSKEGQGKDPTTKKYPPLVGPSIQQHFKLRDSHVAIHTSRAERLKKLAEQASPVIPSTANSLSSASTGSPAGPAGTAVAASSTGGANPAPAPAAMGSSGVGGPPRPTKATSSGLFVRKQSGSSFLRSNAPRPMALPRNPSASQLPLRSPRVDQPSTPRLIQKASRIQILDLSQGNEIMQSMNDDKARLEQAEQREKELKREQRALEIETKKQQDAEKKAQALREKEEKKKERDDAKKLKEKQKQEREEQLQREKQEKEQQQSQARETRAAPDEDDEEEDTATSAPKPARKRTRISSSRRASLEDDDYDGGAQLGHAQEPLSPVTPSLTTKYSSQSLHDEVGPAPMDYTPAVESNRNSDSYFPPHNHQQPPQQQSQALQQLPPSSGAASEHPTLFQDTNLLTTDDRAYITAFMEGHPVIRPQGHESSYQIVMNQEQVTDAAGKTMYELILIEMNFETGEWRKIKRKRNRPHAAATAATEFSAYK